MDAIAFVTPFAAYLLEDALRQTVEKQRAERVALFGATLNLEFPAEDVCFHNASLVRVELR